MTACYFELCNENVSIPGGVEGLAAGTIGRHGQDHMVVEEVQGTTTTAPAATAIGGDTDQSPYLETD